MAETDHHRDEHSEERSTSRTVVGRRMWSPAQLIAGAIGLLLVVVGAVVVLRSGVDSFTGSTVNVVGFEHTTLMGIIHIGAGLMFLGAAAALGGRGSLTFISLAALAFGLVVVIEPGSMGEWVGGAPDIGWPYVVIGAVSLLAAWASPTIMQRRTVTKQGRESRGAEGTRDVVVSDDDGVASGDDQVASGDDG